jgi:hypothetical protein
LGPSGREIPDAIFAAPGSVCDIPKATSSRKVEIKKVTLIELTQQKKAVVS